MTLVRIIKDWKWPDLLRQTPGGKGIWDGVQFTEEPVTPSDYVVVLNRVPHETRVRCSPASVWAIIQEPPVSEYRWLRKGFDRFARVYTPEITFKGPRFFYSHGALPWHVNRDYDWLKDCPPPQKERSLSWITSNATARPGHRRRMVFLEQLQRQIKFDLWGRGFKPLEDKWDGLAPYRYALAIENHSGPHYWTEKIADCFLSWTMPIYFGCTNIYDYFPKESILWIDINRPAEAILQIKEAIASDLYVRRREALAEARRLVLERHQFFPFLSALICEVDPTENRDQVQDIFLPELPFLYPFPNAKAQRQGLWRGVSNLKQKIRGLLK